MNCSGVNSNSSSSHHPLVDYFPITSVKASVFVRRGSESHRLDEQEGSNLCCGPVCVVLVTVTPVQRFQSRDPDPQQYN